VGALYLSRNFTGELFNLEGDDFVKGVLSDFIKVEQVGTRITNLSNSSAFNSPFQHHNDEN
jgi:hypothetical protein